MLKASAEKRPVKEQITISTEIVAAVFSSPTQTRILQELIPTALTLSALARVTGTKLNLLFYHVSRCEKLGLVAVERIETRPGRAIKHYRATAKTYFVPTHLLARLPGADMNRQLRAALDSEQLRNVEGVSFSHDGLRPSMLLKKDPRTRASTTELWLDLNLSAADAASLVSDMRTTMERYRLLGSAGEPRFLVHMAAVRVASL
jgi:hypothetical protein